MVKVMKNTTFQDKSVTNILTEEELYLFSREYEALLRCRCAIGRKSRIL